MNEEHDDDIDGLENQAVTLSERLHPDLVYVTTVNISALFL